ncbi:hypothetical protein BKA80DRAFT_253261 [Phyllosticta citrichinensis]
MEEASTSCELLRRHSLSPARSSTLRPASNRPQHQADPAEACLLPTPLLKVEMQQQDLKRTATPHFDARHQLNPPREAPSPQLFHPQPRPIRCEPSYVDYTVAGSRSGLGYGADPRFSHAPHTDPRSKQTRAPKCKRRAANEGAELKPETVAVSRSPYSATRQSDLAT